VSFYIFPALARNYEKHYLDKNGEVAKKPLVDLWLDNEEFGSSMKYQEKYQENYGKPSREVEGFPENKGIGLGSPSPTSAKLYFWT
jgi:hypothetical protein